MLLTVYYTGLAVVLIYLLAKLAIPKTRAKQAKKITDNGLYFNFTTVATLTALAALLWPVLFMAKIFVNEDKS